MPRASRCIPCIFKKLVIVLNTFLADRKHMRSNNFHVFRTEAKCTCLIAWTFLSLLAGGPLGSASSSATNRMISCAGEFTSALSRFNLPGGNDIPLSLAAKRSATSPLASQISGDALTIANDHCQLQFNGQYLSAMRLDGNGINALGVGWLQSLSGYRWYDINGTWLQPELTKTWENVTNTVPGGTTTDGVYRLNETLGIPGTTLIQSLLDVWLNGSKITMNYSFLTLAPVVAKKNGWLWIFNETVAGYAPQVVDMFWSLESGKGRHCMCTQELKRRPFQYIWSGGSTEYWYQGLPVSNAAVEFDVPGSDAIHLFLAESGYIGAATWSWDHEDGAGNWTLAKDFSFNSVFAIKIHPCRTWYENGPKDYPRFSIGTSSKIGDVQMDYGKALTRLFWERVYTYTAGADGNWIDWSSIEFAWNTPAFLAETLSRIDTIPISPVGHVSSWNWVDGWPFPDNDSDMNNVNIYDTRHPTTNLNFITAIWRLWQWTGNDAWLALHKTMIYRVANFFLNLLVKPGDINNPARVTSTPGALPLPPQSEGLLLCDFKGHTGDSGGIGSNYWDIQPFGWLDAYVNALAYGALFSLADFEQHWKNATGAAMYLQKALQLRQSYTALFWDPVFGRFIGCVDAWGGRHDYGFTFINQQAAYYGLEWGMPLINDTQAWRIYDWMQNEPTGSGLKDTFSRWIFAARANTDINSRNVLNRTVDRDWWVAQGQTGAEGYAAGQPWPWCGGNGQLQNGGCSFYTSYHDLMARAYFFGSDDAEARIRQILDRWSLPDHLCGGSPLYLDEVSQQESSGSVGTDYPFPESGMVPTFLVYGMMGMTPRWMNASAGFPDGHVLVLNPQLPSRWNGYSASNLQFAGTTLNFTVNASAITLWMPLPINASLQLELNGTRYNITSLADVHGRVILPWSPRQEELRQYHASAMAEYNSRLASGATLDVNGQDALGNVPSTLDGIHAWWNATMNLMTGSEYTAYTSEIASLKAKTTNNFPISAVGRALGAMVNWQRDEAESARARGDLRWTLANYRQAMVIQTRLQALEPSAMPTAIIQWMIVPTLMGIAAIVVIREARKAKSKNRRDES